MDDKLLTELLKSKKETDRLEFKQKLEIYDAKGKVVPQQKDEFIKDILGLANGNTHIIRKIKYLIVGADNKKLDDNGVRLLYSVDYKVPTQSEIYKWLNSACSPAIVGLESDTYSYNGVNLFVVIIHPTFDIHETTRELKASGTFQKHTVFMRRDENTEPASVREGVAIQQGKQLHRRDIENPSARWAGAIGGTLAAYLITSAKSSSGNPNVDFSNPVIKVLLILFSGFMGAMIGDFMKFIRSFWYDWHFMTFRERVTYIIFFCVAIPLMYFFLLWISKLTNG